METWLKAKTAGLPRWAWLGLIAGGVGLGLYLRSRNSGKETTEETLPEGGETIAGGEGGFGEGGLAGAGLIGPAGSTSTPVSTPYIPEGILGAFETLTTSLSATQQSLLEHPRTETIIEREAVGGGPPEAGNHETLPSAAAPGAPVKTSPAFKVNSPITAPAGKAHPAAVNTGNKCVNGGVGKHTAPAGYHLYCQGGYIWRAPNS